MIYGARCCSFGWCSLGWSGRLLSSCLVGRGRCASNPGDRDAPAGGHNPARLKSVIRRVYSVVIRQHVAVASPCACMHAAFSLHAAVPSAVRVALLVCPIPLCLQTPTNFPAQLAGGAALALALATMKPKSSSDRRNFMKIFPGVCELAQSQIRKYRSITMIAPSSVPEIHSAFQYATISDSPASSSEAHSFGKG